jgi:DNA-binding protein HU-beta
LIAGTAVLHALQHERKEVAVNKSDLAKAMSAIAGLTRQDAERAIDALIATVMKEVKEGRKVSLMGFGSFVPTRRAARVGRNPRTGAAVRIAASSGVRFASGSLFKSVLNKGGKIPMPTAKAPAKKAPAEKAPAKKAVVKKAAVKKAPAKKAAVKKAAVKKAPAKKAAVKKAPAKKAAVKKAAVKKTPAKKAAVKKAAVKKTGSR